MISHFSVVIPFFRITPNRSQRIAVILQIRIHINQISSPLHWFHFPSHHQSQISKLVHHLKPNWGDKVSSSIKLISHLNKKLWCPWLMQGMACIQNNLKCSLGNTFSRCMPLLSVIVSTSEARWERDGQPNIGQMTLYWPWTTMVGICQLWFWNDLVEGRVKSHIHLLVYFLLS